MRRSPMQVQVRMLRIARFLYAGGILNAPWIAKMAGVDISTAERDMRIVQCYLPIVRTVKKGRRHFIITRRSLMMSDGLTADRARLKSADERAAARRRRGLGLDK